jgi:thiamine pyrophosphokinase
MKIAIVANGQLDTQLLPDIKQADYIIGVDRAAYWLLEQKVTPHIAIGDFDSTSKRELSFIKNNSKTIEEAPHPKYKTDLEMAADHALSLKPTQVTLYGATGTRFDQSLAAVHLLEQFLAHNIMATIRDSNNAVSLIDHTLKIQKTPDFNYFSLISYTEQAVVSIRGARYPLDHYTLARKVSLGISNEISGQTAAVNVHSGLVLVIQSCD